MKRMWALLALLVLVASMVPAALAQGPTPEGDRPQAAPPTGMSTTDPAAGIESLSGSYVTFDPSVGGDTCFIPGNTQTFCFEAHSYTNDYEYVYDLLQRFPSDWTVNNVYVQGTPYCASGYYGSFSWSFQTPPYEVDIYHPRYQQPVDDCVAFYCFEVTSGTGAPDALESWYWSGDGYGGTPHHPCSNDNYTPGGWPACDEAQLPQAAIPPCTMDPIMLTPAEIDDSGCPCYVQEHELTVWNNTGYDTNVDLTYSVIQGGGSCTGPAQVFVPDGTTLPITVNFDPRGDPGDVVICEVYAEDASDPANWDVSHINKTLISGGFDPGGWQLEPIAGATGNQWSGGVVGTNPAAAGEVGYIVGGLGVGSSVPNPDLQMYDPDTGTWTQLTDMPNQRFSPVVGWMGGLLYAAGGYDVAFGATNDLQVYDPATNSWDNTNPANLPANRGGGAGGVGTCSSGAGECLFHVGGGPDSSFANTTLETYQYDPGTNAWTQLDNKPAGSSPDGHILGAGVGCMGYTYVGGDYRGFDEFFRLDATQPAGSQWTQLANIPTTAGAMTPAFVCKEDIGAILLIGGDPDGYWGNYNNTVYVYDIATDTWSGPMPQTLNVAQLGSVAWHMYDAVWTAGGTVGSGAISPMPFESLMQIYCDPGACGFARKEAPATAERGEVIPYTIILETALEPGMFLTDTLPAGVEYAGNLTYTAGLAWYDPADNAVYWTSDVSRSVTAVPAPAQVGSPAAAVDLATGQPEAAGPPAPTGAVPTFAYPEAVLWDNGPLVTHPGGGAGGADASVLQTNLGMNTYGFGNQVVYGYRMADDFEVTAAGGWDIDQITFFAYQTGAPTNPSPINGLYYQIWDGPPDDPTSSVVFGDLATNRFDSSTWMNAYRVTDYDMGGSTRAIFANVATAGVHLDPGIYWLDWMTDGTLSSGPWAPPISILGETTTGNAMQYTTAWAPANDTGTLTQQGMPFIIEGSGGGFEPIVITFDVTVTAYCGDIIVNEGVVVVPGAMSDFMAETEVGGDPDMDLQAPPLWADVCPDGTASIDMYICNDGCPLDWRLEEMSATLVSGPSTPFVPVEVTGAGVNPGLSVASPRVEPGAVPPSPEAVLWDQPLSGVDQNAYVNQEFSDLPDYSSFLADDFTNAEDWAVWTIFVPGDLWNGATDLNVVTALTWQIYADCAGVPCGDPAGGGNPPEWTLSLAPSDPQVVIETGTSGYPSNTTLNLASPVIVPAGTWWLVFYPTMDFSTWGQYGRQPSDTTNGYTGQFINPGGGFGLGTVWQNWSVIGPTLQDIAFRLEGEPATQPVDIPWLSEDPISGTVAPGMCQTVTVTFDATGMTPGDYFANLVVYSGDPDEPQVTLPVTMTVLEPLDFAGVTYVVADLQVSFDATATGGEPITYLWDFGDGTGDTVEDPVHTYAEGGCYTVTLDVANPCGADYWSEMICVCEPVSIVDVTTEIDGCSVTFTPVVSGTAPFTWLWWFGDGMTSTLEVPTYEYESSGTYNVTVEVWNCVDGYATYTFPIDLECGYTIYLPLVFKNY